MNRKRWSSRRNEAILQLCIDAASRLHIAWLEGQYNGLNQIGQARALAKYIDKLGQEVSAEYRRAYTRLRLKPALVDDLARQRIKKEG